MNRNFLFLITLLAGLAGCSLRGPSPPCESRVTENGLHGFTFAAPRGWTAIPPAMGNDSLLHVVQNRVSDSPAKAVFYHTARLEVMAFHRGTGGYEAHAESLFQALPAETGPGRYSFVSPRVILKGGREITIPLRVRSRVFPLDKVDLVFQIVCLDEHYRKKYAAICDRLFDSVTFSSRLKSTPGRTIGYLDHPDQRIRKEIENLPAGWIHFRTEQGHFVILSNACPRFTDEAARTVEQVRSILAGLFPGPGRIDRLPLVRIFRTRGEYLGYGGRPGSSGFWSSRAGELVIYHDRVARIADRVDRIADRVAKAGDRNARSGGSFRVLRHETCHQFLHDLLGAPPAPWLDEGLAEFLGGCRLHEGRVEPVLLEERHELLRTALRRGTCPGLDDLLRLERGEFLASPGLNYARAWSLFHFLFTERGENGSAGDRWLRIPRIWVENFAATGDRKAATRAVLDDQTAGEWEAMEAAWAASYR